MYLLLFIVSLWLQLGLPAELSRFYAVLHGVADYRARTAHESWQGALIATDERYRADRQPDWHDHPVDLLLSLLAQSLTGLHSSAGIQRLRAEPVVAKGWRATIGWQASSGDRRRRAGAMLRVSCTMTSDRPSPRFVPGGHCVQRLAADQHGGVKQSGQLIEQLSLKGVLTPCLL